MTPNAKVQFETNVWQELALKWPDGLNAENEYGQYVKFVTTDQKVWFAPPIAGEKVRALKLGPGGRIEVRKAEVRNGGGKPSIEWQVKRVDPPGQQADGTMAFRKNGAATAPPVAAPVTSSASSEASPNQSSNGTNGNGHKPAVPESPYEHSGQALLLTDTTNMLVDVLARCKQYSTRYNGLIGADDVRSIMLSAYINLAKGGAK